MLTRLTYINKRSIRRCILLFAAAFSFCFSLNNKYANNAPKAKYKHNSERLKTSKLQLCASTIVL